ncbi:hypothetical protein SNOG_14442 [Parastagonospora nodorum SN15]|uniref:Uncharacterized protein n=1 Tax=Phaeosphaeria nodorum (strain SN15 / ATCC MYA-4574 / FGSC 10173) TaxID=321614 RepID=Q0U1Q3_PHANO|nr:hypothetical protein SNOG_14442 [Parastagonospora nodorum SN15]EAT78313.1 hypothetical protein SNOG_14442 [Parastagonospora nodorum SN15]
MSVTLSPMHTRPLRSAPNRQPERSAKATFWNMQQKQGTPLLRDGAQLADDHLPSNRFLGILSAPSEPGSGAVLNEAHSSLYDIEAIFSYPQWWR